HLIWTFYSLYWLCKRRKPEFVICDDLAYHEGMFNKLFHKFGARVHNVSNSAEGDVVFLSEGRVLTRNQIMHKRIAGRIDCLGDESIQWSEQYLRERYAGNNGIAIDRGAFSGKKVITREEVESYIGLNSQKKNVVIMAHTFTDAVFNYGELYFRDYYDWTEKTLSMAAENDTVNWILKPHPTRKAYNEEKDSIEKMYERHKTSNIYWLNDEISAESIKDIADVIITIGGNAGGEFACEGIPAIIVGKPYYQGFGYTIEPKNMEEYRNCLKHVSEIEKLTQEQIVTAKKVFYLRYCEDDNSDLFNDELSRMIKKEYFSMVDQIAIQYFKGDRGTEKYNDRMFQLITEYMEKNDLRTSQYYLKGYEYGRTDEEPKQK
ncbi:MAG TPA: hypothetical protein PLZ77_04045, partial [Lachnospiraceae bacterium]|nr:hypothetical protein [Lachnospiraceae bacterium]